MNRERSNTATIHFHDDDRAMAMQLIKQHMCQSHADTAVPMGLTGRRSGVVNSFSKPHFHTHGRSGVASFLELLQIVQGYPCVREKTVDRVLSEALLDQVFSQIVHKVYFFQCQDLFCFELDLGLYVVCLVY